MTRLIFGRKNCHCSRSVTLSGVTVGRRRRPCTTTVVNSQSGGNLATSLNIFPAAAASSAAVAPSSAAAAAARVAERLEEVGVEDHVDPGVDGRVERH